MNDFEQQLKNALARTDPPPFFEAKVLGAVRRHGQMRRASLRMWWASAVAAALLAMTGSAWQYEKSVREKAAGEDAKARLELALKITSVKLQRISIQIEGIQQN